MFKIIVCTIVGYVLAAIAVAVLAICMRTLSTVLGAAVMWIPIIASALWLRRKVFSEDREDEWKIA